MEMSLRFCLLLCFFSNASADEVDPLYHNTSDSNIHLATKSNTQPPCHVTVDDFSAQRLADIVVGLDIKLLQISLVFPDTVKLLHTVIAIQPTYWYWSYTPIKGSFPYFKWPTDVSILSFGLLDAYTLKDYRLHMNAYPENCVLELGSKDAQRAISSALANMTTTHLTRMSQYNYSYWCYLEEFPGAKDTFAYSLSAYTGYPAEFEGYRCCQFRLNRTARDRYVKCYDTPLNKWAPVMVIPFVLSIVLLLYSPFMFMTMSVAASEQGYESEKAYRNGYIDLDSNYIQTETVHWFVLNNSCPISIRTIFCGLFGLAENYPVVASRIRRAIFLLCAPLLIYVKVLAHFYLQHDLSLELLEHGAPLGFTSLIGGFESREHVFLTNLGGPCIVMLCYYILGFIICIIPRDFSTVLEDGLPKQQRTKIPCSIFSLDLDTIEKLSLVTCIHDSGYKKVSRVLAAQCSMLLRPKYWRILLQIQIQRWRVFWSTHLFAQNVFLQTVYAVPILLALILYVAICGLEIILSTLYYALPLINFTIFAIRGTAIHFFEWVSSSVIGHTQTNSLKNISCRVCQIVCKVVFSVCIIYFVVCFGEIISDSLTFFATVICFTYISGIVFPNESFGYLLFGVGLIYYIFNILSSFGKTYHELLNTTVSICKKMLEGPPNSKIDGNTLVLSLPETGNQLRINETVLTITDEHRGVINNGNGSSKRLYMRYFNLRPAIEKSLFLHIVRKHRPVHIQLFFTFLELICICSLVYISLTAFNQFYFKRDDSGIVKVLSILVMGTLPQILRSIFLDKHREIEDANKRRRLEHTIVECFQNIKYTQSSQPI